MKVPVFPLAEPAGSLSPASPNKIRSANRRRVGGWASLLGLALLLTACATRPTLDSPPAVAQPEVPRPAAPPVAAAPAPVPELVSSAESPREYRRDGARHIYGKNQHRIFKGKMPPLMHAVGVLQVDLDAMGQVRRLNWMRAPSHAPDVVREIERTVYAAAPFPAPVRLGQVTYTDVWLWDKSGHFQLDTLTEGQRNK